MTGAAGTTGSPHRGPHRDGDNVCGFTVGMGAKNPCGDGVNNTRGHCTVRFEICCSLSPSILWCKCFFETVVIKEKAALCVLLQTAVNVGITTDGWSVLCRL